MMDDTARKHKAIWRALKRICGNKNCWGKGKHLVESNLQHTHTPHWLCQKVISELGRNTGLCDKDILTFNLEFVEVLLYDFGVDRKRVWLATDCREKAAILEHPRYRGVNARILDLSRNGADMGRQFDVVIMNPPFHKPSTASQQRPNHHGEPLWPDFVNKALSLCKEDGFCAFVHPSKWRKPENKFWPLLSRKCLAYLEIHDDKDGDETFKTKTRYDWYVLQNSKADAGWNTTVIDENGIRHEFKLGQLPCLPNFCFDEFLGILAGEGEKRLDVLPVGLEHDVRRPGMSKKKNQEFKYPCVHSIRQGDKVSFYYSNRKSDMFVPKIILSDSRHLYPIIDTNGEYGMSAHCFGIKIDSIEWAGLTKKAIESPRFKDIVRATKWASYETDYRMFKLFKRDFWKAFVDENGNEK